MKGFKKLLKYSIENHEGVSIISKFPDAYLFVYLMHAIFYFVYIAKGFKKNLGRASLLSIYLSMLFEFLTKLLR